MVYFLSSRCFYIYLSNLVVVVQGQNTSNGFNEEERNIFRYELVSRFFGDTTKEVVDLLSIDCFFIRFTFCLSVVEF